MTNTQHNDAKYAQEVGHDWANTARWNPARASREEVIQMQELAAQAYESARNIMGIV